jgi:hypothetical protein
MHEHAKSSWAQTLKGLEPKEKIADRRTGIERLASVQPSRLFKPGLDEPDFNFAHEVVRRERRLHIDAKSSVSYPQVPISKGVYIRRCSK